MDNERIWSAMRGKSKDGVVVGHDLGKEVGKLGMHLVTATVRMKRLINAGCLFNKDVVGCDCIWDTALQSLDTCVMPRAIGFKLRARA